MDTDPGEVDLDALLTAIYKEPKFCDICTLHQLVTSREIEDIENINLKKLCEIIWISLLRCWSSKEFTETEHKIWETTSWLLSLPTFTSTKELVRQIINTVTREFCTKLFNSFERGILQFEEHGGHLLRWIYLRSPPLRRPLRALMGSRLVKYAQRPDVLKVVNVNPLLRLVGDIIAGSSTNPSIVTAPREPRSNAIDKRQEYAQRLHFHHHLLVSVLLPLHCPNQMIEWRDQIPVLQPYHESLVRCLVRLVQWDKSTSIDNIDNRKGNNDKELHDESGDDGDHCSTVVFSEPRTSLSPWKEEEERSDGEGENLPPSHPRRQLQSQPRRYAASDKEKEQKGGSLLEIAVRTLLESLWPEGFTTNTPKEILLLHEVEKLLELCSAEEFAALLDPVLNRLKISLMHDNVRTIQRSLQFFRNDSFLAHIAHHAPTVIHRLLPPLYRRGSLFWNSTVNKMTAAVLKTLQGLDAECFASTANEVAGGGAEPKLPSKRALATTTTTSTTTNSLSSGSNPSRAKSLQTLSRSRPPKKTDGQEGRDSERALSSPSTGSSLPLLPPTSSSSSSSSSSSLLMRPPITSMAAPRKHTTLPPHTPAPPASDMHNRGSSNSTPIGVSVPTGSLRQQLLSSSSSLGATPPVTITGVAPWAFQQQSPKQMPQSQQRHLKVPAVGRGENGADSGKEMLNPVTSSTSSPTGLQLVRRYMKRCRLNGSGKGSPSSTMSGDGGGDFGDGDDDDDEEEEDEDAPSAWSRDQASVQPKLLPHLRFHDLVFGPVLGEGSFGTVKYGRQIIRGPTSLRSQWPEYAVKILSSSKLRQHEEPQEQGGEGATATVTSVASSRLQAAACREIAALHALSHPGIARLISAFRYTDCFYLVLEYASQGDLHTYIIEQGPMNETCTRFVLGEICAALLSIHDLGLAYNDLKPENVLITEVGHVKLADFGACRAVTGEGKKLLSRGNVLLSNLRDGDWRDKGTSESPHQQECHEHEQRSVTDEQQEECEDEDVIEAEGTPGYLPPEVLSHSRGPGGGHCSDSWALGCVLFFCLVGRPRYFGSSFQQVLQQIRADEAAEGGSASGILQQDQAQAGGVHFDSAVTRTATVLGTGFSCSPEAEGILLALSSPTMLLLQDLMRRDPSTRLSVADACAHDFFTQTPSSSSSKPHDDEGWWGDPRSFHQREPVKLPRQTAGEGGEPAGGKGEDRAWARRQCSMVWSPMPQAYDFQADTEADRGRRGAGSVHGLFAGLEREPIVETAEEEEAGCWLP